MPVYLVRHAAAGDRYRWDGDDRDRPLNSRGRAQAERLVDVLGPYRPSRVISSGAARCVETVAPLAGHLALETEIDSALFEGETQAAVDLVRRVAEEADGVVLCSHGDVIPHVLEALARHDGWGGAPADRCEKGSTWILDRGPEGWRAAYLPVRPR